VPSGILAKHQDSHKLIWGTKGPLIEAWVHRDRKVTNPIANQSMNLPSCAAISLIYGIITLNSSL